MGNFGFNGRVPCLNGEIGCVCYSCPEGAEDNFLLDFLSLMKIFTFVV